MVKLLVRVFEYAVPDPFIFAVALTLLTSILAIAFAPHHAPLELLGGWYKGIFDILQFALQMILILVTGYALANSKPVERGLQRLAAIPKSGKDAVALTFIVSALACWLNWGFGLVVAALLSREIAKRVRVDFGWLVAAAYSGFLIWASGLSSSIALAQATPGNKLNIVQTFTHHVLPISTTIFAPFNWVPCVILVVVLLFVLRALQPADAVYAQDGHGEQDVTLSSPGGEVAGRSRRAVIEGPTLSARLNDAWILNVIIALAGFGYLVASWTTGGFSLDINSVIFIFFCAGLLLHWRPSAYVAAINDAARITGPLIVQYPLYGGIMGIMTTTGLAGVIAAGFDTFASAHTLPFWNYIASIIISLFVPSGGGHWAVQGPFAVPAAMRLHASMPATAMAVAMGEQVANMIQPFWALPILAIAGVGLQRVMAFTAVSFMIAFVIFGLSLLLLV